MVFKFYHLLIMWCWQSLSYFLFFFYWGRKVRLTTGSSATIKILFSFTPICQAQFLTVRILRWTVHMQAIIKYEKIISDSNNRSNKKIPGKLTVIKHEGGLVSLQGGATWAETWRTRVSDPREYLGKNFPSRENSKCTHPNLGYSGEFEKSQGDLWAWCSVT